ncbi:TolB family protein [Actinomadura sp. 3N508]|uniref:TolB family protein n=1 Tax=Actinomadura sp. 3N508 TaxID=3375153 RepID=UPI0037B5C434
MTRIEDRLGRALDAATTAVRPEDLAPLTAPGPRPSRPSRRWAPVVAALMVVTVVAAAVVVTGRGQERDTRPVSAASRYLLTLPPGEGPGVNDPARILDLYSGREFHRVPAPRGVGRWSAAAGTSGNRMFYLLGTPKDGENGPDRLYRLRIDDRGRPVQLAPIPGGELPGMGNGRLVASADGGTLAFTSDASGRPERPRTRVHLLKVATGQRTTWESAGVAEYLSLSADGRRLAFAWFQSLHGDGIRVLDTVRPSGDVLARSQRVAIIPGPLDEVTSLWTAANGHRFLLVSAEATRTRLVEVSPTTGKVTATVLQRTPSPPASGPASNGPGPGPATGPNEPAFSVLCRSGDSRHVLLSTGTARQWLDLRNGRTTTLRHPDALFHGDVAC